MQTMDGDEMFEDYLKYTSHRLHGKRTWIHGVSERQVPFVDHALRNEGSVLFIEPQRDRYEFAMKNFPGALFRNASLQTALTACDEDRERVPDNLFLFGTDASRLVTLGLMEYFRVRKTWVVAEFCEGYRPWDFDPQIWCCAINPRRTLLVWSLKLKGM